MRRVLATLAATLALTACGDSRAPTLTVLALSTPPVALVQVPVQFQAVVARGKAPYRFRWLFGDASTSDEQNPAHAYRATGVFTVQVDVEDAGGEKASAQIAVTVLANTPATVGAQAQPTTGVAPLSVQFTGTGGGDMPVSYAWEFGDGTGSGLQNPTHTYQFAGTYRATLRVTDATGDVALQDVTIAVEPPPPPPPPDRQPIAAPAVLNPRGVAPHTASFVANATGGDGTLAYQWDFGDGSQSQEENPSHTYANPGTYRVQFAATDEDGDAVRATLSVEVVPDRLPSVAIVQAFPTVGCGTLTTSLRAQATGGDEPYSYGWDFGDATPPGVGDSVTHTYAAPGTYRVKVTATDVDGDTAEATTSLFVFQPDALSVSMSVSPVSGPAPLQVTYTLGTTCGRPPFRIEWEFGDGIAAQGGSVVRHTFDAPGEYDTVVRVTDSSPTPVVRTLSVRIRVLDAVPGVAISSFAARVSGTLTCYDFTAENAGGAPTAGCYALRDSPDPAPCGVVAAVFPNRASAPRPNLAPRTSLLGPIHLGGSAAAVDLAVCLGLLRQGAAAIRFLPAALGPAERWPQSVCVGRPPGVDRPWLAVALNDPRALARRPAQTFAVSGIDGGTIAVPGARINEVSTGSIELRGVAGASVTGLSLELERSGGSSTTCSLTGSFDTAGLFTVNAGCVAGPLPASGATLRLKSGTTLLDVVGYGTGAPATEGAPAPAIPPGGVIARIQDGVDTGDNARDFVALPSGSLGAPNPSPGEVAGTAVLIAPDTCAAFAGGATSDFAGYGPDGTTCAPGDCTGPDQVLAADLTAGTWRLDVVGFEVGAIAGWHVIPAVVGVCAASGTPVASGAGDAVGVSLSSLPAGRYCIFVEGAPSFAGSRDYAVAISREGP